MPDPQSNIPPLWDIVVTLVLSLISATVSVTRRIIGGTTPSCLWIVSEFLTALLCGYIMFEAFPDIALYLPDFVTLPIAVALAAHSGGRIFQESEETLILLVERFLGVGPKIK